MRDLTDRMKKIRHSHGIDTHYPQATVTVHQFGHFAVALAEVGVDLIDRVVQPEMVLKAALHQRMVRRAIELHGAVRSAILTDAYHFAADYALVPAIFDPSPAMSLAAFQSSV